MIRVRKLFIVFIAVCAVCVFSGLGASLSLSAFYGEYISTTDNNSSIEFVDSEISQKTAIVNLKNINCPKSEIKNYSEKGVRAKIFRKKGKNVVFTMIIDGKKVVGYYDIGKKSVTMEGVVYVKK